MFYPDAGARESAVAVTVVRGGTRGMWAWTHGCSDGGSLLGRTVDAHSARTHTLCVRSLRLSRMEADVYNIFTGHNILRVARYHSVTVDARAELDQRMHK